MEGIDKTNLPKHIAIIMDGNGRWAKTKGKLRIFGHQKGVRAVRETVEAAAEIGIKYLTLYAFSTENWNRPKNEVNALMTLLVSSIHKETKTLMDNDICLTAIGNINDLPSKAQEKLEEAVEKTKVGTYKDFSMTEDQRYELYIAGWLHDCGKVATPVHVVDKSTKLETIYDRVENVQTRFEILKRDIEIDFLKQIICKLDLQILDIK